MSRSQWGINVKTSMQETIKSLEKRLEYHSYCFERETEFPVDSLIETLEIALSQKTKEQSLCPDVTLPFRDVIESLHQINEILLCDGKDEIDRSFFGTGMHLPISFYISAILKSLLDCHNRFKARGVSSEILVQYAWLLSEAWYYTLCQDTINLWAILVSTIKFDTQNMDVNTVKLLIECVPFERRNSEGKMHCVVD